MIIAPQGIQGIQNGFVRHIIGMFNFWIVGIELTCMYHVGARIAPLGYLFVMLPLFGILTALSYFLERGHWQEMASVSLCVIVCFFQRRFEAWHHLKHSDTDRHTLSPGQSFINLLKPITPKFMDFLFDPWLQLRLFQPAIVASAGILVWVSGESKAVAIFLCVGGIMSALKQSVLYDALVAQLLQQYDAQLEQYYAPRILSGKAQTATERAGIPVNSVALHLNHRLSKPDLQATVRRAMGGNIDTQEAQP